MTEAFAMVKKSLLLVATPTSAFNRRMVRSASVSRASCSGRSSRSVGHVGASGAIGKLNCEDLKLAFTNGLETPRTAKNHSLTRGTYSIQNRDVHRRTGRRRRIMESSRLRRRPCRYATCVLLSSGSARRSAFQSIAFLKHCGIKASCLFASQDSPSPIAPTSGRLAQAELGHQVLCGPSADAELGGDHAGRDERPAHDIVHEGRQARGGTAMLERARQQA